MAEDENAFAASPDSEPTGAEAGVEAEDDSMGMEVHIGHEPDKYALDDAGVEIDCESRLHLCRAACCRLRFPLTEQDIREGIVQWQLDQPYMNRQRVDGYCVHCSATGLRCQVYEQRPTVCRRYDCRQDRRIWSDFERRIVSTYLERGGHPEDASPE